MSDTPEKPGQLGRGLSALLGEDSTDYASLDKVRLSKMVPVEFLQPNPFQPRHRFDADSIDALVESIKEKGIIQPIIVRRHPQTPNAYEIVAGERRWRAAQKAQLHEVPVVIKDLSDSESLEVALVENIQRQNLTPLEEAEAYQRLMDEFSYVQEALGRAVGKSRSHVANTMRLLGLPDSVKALLDEGALSAGHGRALLNADDPEGLARKVVKDGLNVRQTERLAQPHKPDTAPRKAAASLVKDPNTVALENDLSNLLGLRVMIKFRGSGGALTVHYKTLEQLDDVLRRLQHHTESVADAPDDPDTMAMDQHSEPINTTADADDPVSPDDAESAIGPMQHADATISDADDTDADAEGPAKSKARTAIEAVLGGADVAEDDAAEQPPVTEQTEQTEPIEQDEPTSDIAADSEKSSPARPAIDDAPTDADGDTEPGRPAQS